MKACAYLRYLAEFFLEGETFPIKVVKKVRNTLFMFTNIFLENCALYEVMWENMVESYRP